MQSSKAKFQIMAYLLDSVVVYAFGLLLFCSPVINLVSGIRAKDNNLILYSALYMVAFGAIFMLFFIFYFVIIPYFKKGQTLGKMVFKIKVVKIDGSNLDALTLFLREIVGRYFINLLTLGFYSFILLLTVCLSPENRGFHDVLASTRVVDIY